MGNVAYQGSSLETQFLGFCWELVMLAPSVQQGPKFQTPRRKASVEHAPYCLYKYFRHSEPLLLGNGGNPPKNTSLQMPAKVQPYMEAFLRIAVSSLLTLWHTVLTVVCNHKDCHENSTS
jgi:hypothetical protein